MEQDQIQLNTGRDEEINLKEPRKKLSSWWPVLLVIVAFSLGISSGYAAWG